MDNLEFPEPNKTIGNPGNDVNYWPGKQSFETDCAIRCQQFLIKLYQGTSPSEQELVAEAQAKGWFSEQSGTPMEAVGNLLEAHGLPVVRYQHANLFNLTSELAQGHKVIVGLHSGDLWQQDPWLEKLTEALGLHQADHAVVVTGIDTRDAANPSVLISDPGTGEALATYPVAQFLNAWSHSDFFMVATQAPAPAWLPEMVHFDYAAGHVEALGQLPWSPAESLLEPEPTAVEHLPAGMDHSPVHADDGHESVHEGEETISLGGSWSQELRDF